MVVGSAAKYCADGRPRVELDGECDDVILEI